MNEYSNQANKNPYHAFNLIDRDVYRIVEIISTLWLYKVNNYGLYLKVLYLLFLNAIYRLQFSPLHSGLYQISVG
jgi:hypothetical protein